MADWIAAFTATEVTVADMTAKVTDPLNAIGNPWTAFTPTWTAVSVNPALGNGTLAGRYRQANKAVEFKIDVTIGSTTTVGTGGWRFAAPVTAVGIGTCGEGVVFDTSVPDYRPCVAHLVSTSLIQAIQVATTGAGMVGSAGPVTWATGDVLSLHGSYEAA